MISLQDKIQKFQKLIYNKQLDDFIPIDDQFIGGGITMQSLIKQNSFIVEEIKKMKSVFVNYCKLNQNVYEKIIQHQLTLHTENNKLVSLSENVQRKMNDSIKQVKQMYQEMKYQTLKTKDLVGEAVRPIQEAIRQKVDESSFTKQMKKILLQLQDNDGDPSNQHNQGSILGQNDQLSIRRKKGKSVYYEQYIKDKQKTTRLFLQLSQKLQNIEYKNRENDILLYKNTTGINKMTLLVDNHQNQIFRLNKEMKQVRTNIQLAEQRLQSQITSKTNDSVWEKRFNAFEAANLTPKIFLLTKQIDNNQKQNNKSFADLQPRFRQIKTQIQQLNKQSQQHTVNHSNLQIKLLKQQQKLQSQIHQLNNKLKKLQQLKKIKIQKVYETIESEISIRKVEIQKLHNIIKQLSKQLETTITKNVKKNVDVKIHQIDTSINKLNVKTHNMKEEINQAEGEIHNIKEILCKKANFTDILIHFEKKADKQDFKQLKDKIQTAPSYLKSTIIQSPQKTRRTISSNSRRKSHSKNFINPVNINNFVNNNNFDKQSLESDFQGTSRLYLMGLENDLGTQNDRRRMSFTQSALRRKKKSNNNTGMISIFGN